MAFNPNKNLSIEIESNDISNSKGYTIWHVINGQRKRTMSRNADGKDFDFMTDKQMELFNNGSYKFKITAAMASEFFEYIY